MYDTHAILNQLRLLQLNILHFCVLTKWITQLFSMTTKINHRQIAARKNVIGVNC